MTKQSPLPPVEDPIALFGRVFERARASGTAVPEAVALATATSDGRPSVRMVLLKDYDAEGFVFYTNLKSRKGRELAANAHASLCFWWGPIEEQVRVEGKVEPVDEEEADAYFASRPRESQLGAWASHQSSELATRDALLLAFDDVRRRYEGGNVPRPPHWSGFRLVPQTIEFWTGKPHRLHDRRLYTRTGLGWRVSILAP